MANFDKIEKKQNLMKVKTSTMTNLAASFITATCQAFKKHADPLLAPRQSAYMRHLFTFTGLSQPIRKEIQKQLFKSFPISSDSELIEILSKLWEQQDREFQYLACDLAIHYKKLWSASVFSLFEDMIRSKSWWDTVDAIASNLVGKHILNNRSLLPMMDQWINDPYLWIKRSALIFQLKWKGQTDETRLFSFCKKTMHENDFFIRKAIGWILREYSKTNPAPVLAFIEEHRQLMSPLSIREGSKYLTGIRENG